MWTTDYSGEHLIRMSMMGTSSRPATFTSFNPTSMAVGSDGKFYVGSHGTAEVDQVTTAGVIKTFSITSGDVASYNGMTLGPDGNVWFTENSHVAKITTAGIITEFPFKDSTTSNYFDGITTGPDGNLWVAEYFSDIVDKVVPGTGAMTEFTLNCNPYEIVSAKGNLWTTCSNELVEISTAGVETEFYQPFNFAGTGQFLAVGPDGNPWFGASTGNEIGEFDPGTGEMTYYTPPSTYGQANALTLGPDGNMWAINNSARSVQVYIINVMSVSPTSVTLAAVNDTANIVVTQKGTTAWTATSENTAVATVAQGSPADTFVITAKAKGQTKVIVSDAVGNSFPVLVTVQ